MANKLYHHMATSYDQCIQALVAENELTFPTFSNDTLWCNATWDTFLCWPAIPANTSHTLPCPPLRGLLADRHVEKECHASGRWTGEYENDFSKPEGYTNYRPCMSMDFEVFERAQEIALHARKLEFVGLTLSLLSLIVAISIFSMFRRLRVVRNQIHQQLFIALLLKVIVRLILYIDLSLSKDISSWVQNSEIGYTVHSTKTLCEAFYLLLEYLKTVAFAFCFIEGFYLHNAVVVKVFQDDEVSVFWRYLAFGWGVPVVHISLWVSFLLLRKDFVLDRCLGEYYMQPEFWIMDGVRLFELLLNTGFLLNIVRVLWTKVKETHSLNEVGQLKKSVKAALMLIPLLGIPNIMQTIPFAPSRNNIVFFAVFTYCASFFYMFQGLMVTVLYCFRNREVINVIKSHYNRYRLSHTSADMLRRGSRAASTFYQGNSEYEQQAHTCNPQEVNHHKCPADVSFNGDVGGLFNGTVKYADQALEKHELCPLVENRYFDNHSKPDVVRCTYEN